MVDAGRLPDEDRAALAERLGYRQIGKELPDSVTLQDIIKSLPEEVFEINPVKAWSAVALTLASVSASIFFIAVSPWYLLPLAWAFASAAWTGFFVVGHDCGHRSFSKNKLVEDIVGTLMFMPLIYPFDPWRIKHNQHHAHTNKLVEDTAWHPVRRTEMSKWSPAMAAVYKTFLGTPLKLWASIGHWALWHFDLNKYSDNQKPRVIISIAACVAFMAIGWPLIITYTGMAGFVKFWLMPWLGYHFWMSTFTVTTTLRRSSRSRTPRTGTPPRPSSPEPSTATSRAGLRSCAMTSACTSRTTSTPRSRGTTCGPPPTA